MIGLYMGTVQGIYPVGDARNQSKYQVEYSVLVSVENNAQIPINHCYRTDANGILDDFQDEILSSGAQVWVMCPRGNYSTGIIVGCNRQYALAADPSYGKHYRKRFNKIEMLIDQNKNWSVTSDSGPNLHINTDKIIIDDSAGQTITFDKAAKTLTILATALTINVQGDTNMTVQGNLNATVQGNANVTATGNVTVVGAEIILNKQMSGVTTANSHLGVIDLITNVPVTPSTTTFGDV